MLEYDLVALPILLFIFPIYNLETSIFSLAYLSNLLISNCISRISDLFIKLI